MLDSDVLMSEMKLSKKTAEKLDLQLSYRYLDVDEQTWASDIKTALEEKKMIGIVDSFNPQLLCLGKGTFLIIRNERDEPICAGTVKYEVEERSKELTASKLQEECSEIHIVYLRCNKDLYQHHGVIISKADMKAAVLRYAEIEQNFTQKERREINAWFIGMLKKRF